MKAWLVAVVLRSPGTKNQLKNRIREPGNLQIINTSIWGISIVYPIPRAQWMMMFSQTVSLKHKQLFTNCYIHLSDPVISASREEQDAFHKKLINSCPSLALA